MRSFMLLSILAIGLALSSGVYAENGICRNAADVEQLQARHWCEVPDSQLRSVEKKPSEFDDWNGSSSQKFDSFQRVQGVNAVTMAWNSAAFDTKRNCLLVTGGGHNDYGGNEVYQFCLNNLRWARRTDPTAFPNRNPEIQNSDGTPVSRHTFGGLAYLPVPDRLFVFDGAPDSAPGGCGTQGTWTLDLAAQDDSAYAPANWELRTTSNEPDHSCGTAAAYDPVSELVIVKASRGTHTYDFNTNRWSQVSNAGYISGYQSLVIDPKRRMLVEIGQGTAALWSIDDGYTGGVVSTSGGSSIESVNNPGLAYDVRLDRIVGWSGGKSVYVFDVDARSWATIAPADTNVADPGPVTTSGGVYSRFNYSPALNVYMFVDRVDQNVMLYRLGDGEPLVRSLPPGDLTSEPDP